ncbi:phycobilisome protein [Trichothermofontia sp.]
MHTLNHTLEKNVLDADGRYLSLKELQPLEQYVETYRTRLDTYHKLRDNSEQLVLTALRKLAQVHPEVIQKHGQRCKYDMAEVLRYIALSVLRDDEIFFKEQMMVWLDTILLAHKRTAHCSTAYRYLQDAINETLPSQDSGLIHPYIDVVISALQAHA